MKIAIPLLVSKIGSGKRKAFRVRPLFTFGPAREHEHLERAMHKLVEDLRELFSNLGKLPRHDDLAGWSFCPDLDESRIDVIIEMRRRTVRQRMLFVVFDALERRMAFCPHLPDHWFEIKRGESLTGRASEVMTEYFRTQEREQDDGEVRPEACALEGAAWVSVLEMDIHPIQRLFPDETDPRLASLGEIMPAGGSAELRRVGRCLDHLYPDGLDRVRLRDAEVEELTQLLHHNDRRPILLVGPPQVGKTAILHEYVWRNMAARKDPYRDHPEVWLLSPQRLISGMMFVGQWENRLLAILAHARKRDHTLYFDDLLGLYLAGRTSQSDLSVAHVLKPYAERRDVRILSEMTPEALRVLRERDRSFADLFHILPVRPPNDDDTLRILLSSIRQLESRHQARFELDVLPTVLDLTRRYVRHQSFPGKAAMFLRRLAVKNRGETAGRPQALKAFHEQTGLTLAFLDGQVKLSRQDILSAMSRDIIGQPAALEATADAICVAKARLNDPDRPVAVFLFLGPTGVGKTQCAKAIAKYLFGTEERLVRFDMNEYLAPGAAARLSGTFDQPEGLLTAAVRRQPFSVLLLDEIEKANPEVFDLLLQVLGEGRLTDALGRTADFTNVLIILTSNLGVREAEATIGLKAEHDPKAYLRAAQRFFRPEFVNRIDRIVPFNRLTREDVARIARMVIRDVLQREGLVRRKCVLRIEAEALERVVDTGFDPVLGARALKRAVEEQLAQPVGVRLAAGLPETITVIGVYPQGEGLGIDVRGLSEVTPAPDVDRPLGNPDAVLDAASAALRRIEEQFAHLRPSGELSSSIEGGQLFYLAIQDEIRTLRATIRELREEREDTRMASRAKPSLPAKPAKKFGRTKRDWDSRPVLGELAAAADIRLYLRDMADRAVPITLDPEPRLRRLAESLAVLEVMASASEQPEGDQLILYVWSATPAGVPFVKHLATLYHSIGFTESRSQEEDGQTAWYGVERGWVLEPTGVEAALVVRGLGAARYVEGELGTHLFCTEHGGLAPVQVFAWDLAEGQEPLRVIQERQTQRSAWLAALRRGEGDVHADPLAMLPVMRIYNPGDASAIDLRTERVEAYEVNVPRLIRAALPWPRELTEL